MRNSHCGSARFHFGQHTSHPGACFVDCAHLAGAGEWSRMEWLCRLRLSCLERAFAGLRWLGEKRGRTKVLPPHLLTGMQGEEAASIFLLRHGCTLVARRWSSGDAPGDVDLIAWDGPVLCMVEVKTRTAHDTSPAEIAVNLRKRRVLRQLARHYLRQLPGANAPPVRFDVISVYLVAGAENEILHFKGSFGWSEQERPS